VSSGFPPGPPAPRASLALDNLRASVILLVVAFHSALAYLNFLPAAPFAFNNPPYLWRAFPIVDTERWFGFDLFCAWQDVFLMSLFFSSSRACLFGRALGARERGYSFTTASCGLACRLPW